MLDATLTVTPSQGGFDLTFSVENAGADPVTLSFRDGQRAEFVAERTGGDGEGAWHWSADRAFAMALGTEELPPGESLDRTATWPDPDPGEYAVRAWLTATDAEAEAETEVVVD